MLRGARIMAALLIPCLAGNVPIFQAENPRAAQVAHHFNENALAPRTVISAHVTGNSRGRAYIRMMGAFALAAVITGVSAGPALAQLSPSPTQGGNADLVSFLNKNRISFTKTFIDAVHDKTVLSLTLVQTGAALYDGGTTSAFVRKGYREGGIAEPFIGESPTVPRMLVIGGLVSVGDLLLTEKMHQSRFWEVRVAGKLLPLAIAFIHIDSGTKNILFLRQAA